MNVYENIALKLKNYEKDEIVCLLNEPMKNHTSFKIGGVAGLFVTPKSAEALAYAYNISREHDAKIFILGKGTNVLFDDEGFDGVVISTLGLDFSKIEGNTLTFGAGFSFTTASRVALENSLYGMTFAYGIPGSIGGAVFMNAGAYNGEVSFVLKESTYLDTADGKIYTLPLEEHKFDYRHSVYRDHPEWVIISATFSLKKGNYDEIKAEMDDFMNRRRTKQPLEYPSAGSTFKRYPGRYTGQMIDELGLKGTSVGAAQVSEKHAGFVINKGNATSRDVKELIELVKAKIKEAYGIDIECEVIFVG